jgi:nitrite reductase/ring-hydroxylating ferredoxin subunit
MTVASIATFSTFSKDMAEAENEFKEVEITFASELKEGDMKTVKVGEKDDEKVLISRYLGKLYATGNACSHFGVPLEGGMLFDDKVLCPAHGAGFSVVDGTPELAPGLNGLPTFPIVEKDGKYFVKVPADKLPGSVA